MTEEPVDVLVIGAGAAGAAVAKRLSDRGVSVVCLEQGDWVDRQRVPKTAIDWEVRGRRYWSPNPNVRRWPADYPVASYGANPIDAYLYNAVGGSTIGFAANYWRLAPSDFRVRTLDGVAVDWPLTYEELAPFYDAMLLIKSDILKHVGKMRLEMLDVEDDVDTAPDAELVEIA